MGIFKQGWDGDFYGDGTGKSDGDGDYFIHCITL